MRHRPHRGRVYRRCACRDTRNKQLGARCPDLLANSRHGTWTFAVDMPSLQKKRATLRRGGFASKKTAQDALAHKTEQTCWTPTQAATFLRHCADIDDPLRNLYELIIGTGLRKGEALALHWADIDLDEDMLFVKYTLSSIRNTTPVMTSPKTPTSHAWVSLSTRVRAALDRQAQQQADAGLPGQSDLVFCRADGQPLRPEYVVRHLHKLSDAAGLPRIRVHDLRHLAATLMITSRVPIAMASKTMRHSKLSTTVDTYGHLAPYAAQDAVDAIETALDTADSTAAHDR